MSEVSPYTVGRTVESQLPFVAVPVGGDVYELRLEDLARFAMPADNDYNDRVWVFELVVLAGGPLLAPPLAAPVPPPPGGEKIVFSTVQADTVLAPAP